MQILDSLPLFGAVLGVLLSALIAFGSGSHKKNKRARAILFTIVALQAYALFDNWLFFIRGHNSDYVGISYLFYHLTGVLLFLYTNYLFKVEPNVKLWGSALAGYTLLRIGVLLSIDADPLALDDSTAITSADISFIVDYYLSLLLNIVFLFLAFLKVKNLDFAVALNRSEQLNYRWLKNLLIISIIFYAAIIQSSIISLFDLKEWIFYGKIETLITSLFIFAIAFSAIRFPVFAVHGDFNELEPAEESEPPKKYARSSLKDDDSEELWQGITRIMENEQPYRTSTYRLNDLAASTGKSVHHVSQVINAKQGGSFSDFVNDYRIRSACDLLQSPRADEITILAIAMEVGFNSKTAFYNAFKKSTGMTPSNFKKTARSQPEKT